MIIENDEDAKVKTQELEALIGIGAWQGIILKGVGLARSLSHYWISIGEKIIVPTTIGDLDEDRTNLAFVTLMKNVPASNLLAAAIVTEVEWKRNDVIEAIKWVANFSRENVDKTEDLKS